MNAPAFTPHAQSTPDQAGKAMAREDAHERLEDIRRLAVVTQEFLVLGDDRGSAYAFARLIANAQNVAKTLREIEKGAGK